jgi:F-type H+-transporting ATPase subunit gamma
MDRAAAATAYTQKITEIVSRLAEAGLEVSHPLLETRENPQNCKLLMLTSNRGLCGGYNGSVLRLGNTRLEELRSSMEQVSLEVSGRRGISGLKFRGVEIDQEYTQFEDQPAYEDVAKIADTYLAEYAAGRLDRLDVVYTRFISTSKQEPVVETLLPLGSLGGEEPVAAEAGGGGAIDYEFLPSAESILEEVVPTSFKVRLFKCFLDAAVSEQVARMIAMKSATENAGDMIKQLSMTYNRARQSQITGEIMEIIAGVEAMSG